LIIAATGGSKMARIDKSKLPMRSPMID